MSRRLIKLAAWIAGSAALLLGLLWLVLWGLAASDWGRAKVLELLNREVEAATQAQLTLGDLEGNPLTNLVLRDVSLRRGGRELARAAEIELRYNPLALLSGRVHLGRLRLVRPWVGLPLDLPPDQGGGSLPGLALTIARLEVVDGGLEAGGSLGRLRRAEGVQLEGEFSLDARGPRAEARLAWANLSLDDLEAPLAVSGRVAADAKRLTVESLLVQAGRDHLEASGQYDWGKAPRLNLKARGRITDWRTLAGWSPAGAPPPEPVDFRLEASGPQNACQVKASLQAAEGSLDLAGRLNLDQPGGELKARFAGLDLSRLGLTQKATSLGGSLELSSQGWPGSRSSQARLDCGLDQTTWGDWQLKNLTLRLRHQDGHYRVESLELVGDQGRAQASGELIAPEDRAGEQGPWRAQGQVAFQDLALPPDLLAGLPEPLRQARLNGLLRGQGSLDAAGEASLELSLDRSPLGPELELTSLKASGGRQAGKWRLTALELTAPGLSFKAQGRVDAEVADLEWELASPALALLRPAVALAWDTVPPALAGALRAHGNLRGPWSGPALEAQAQAQELDLGRGILHRAELELSAPDLVSHRQGRANLLLEGLEGGDLPWHQVRVELTGDGRQASLRVNGRGPLLDLALNATSPIPLQMPLRFNLAGLSLTPAGGQAWRQQGQSALVVGAHNLDLDRLLLVQGQQRLELTGQVSPGGRVRASLDLKNFAPAPWLPERGLPPTTRLELNADLTGTLVEPVMRLEGRLHGLAWRRVGEGLVSFNGRLGGGELSLAGRVTWAEQPVLDLNATLGLDASLNPPNLELTAEGLNARLTGKDLPLHLLAPTMRGVRILGGRLDLDLRAQGDPSDPHLEGTAELSGGNMVITPTGQRITDINLAFTARGREIILTRGEADSGGHLSLHGRMLLPWKDAGRVELKAQGKDLLVGLGALGQVVTDLDLDLDGTPAAPKARALLHPSQAVIHPRVAPPAALGDVVLLRPGQTPPPLDTEVNKAPRIFFPEPFHNLALEAWVDLGSGIRVVVDEGWVSLLGVVRVTKAAGGPLVFWDRYRTDNGVIMVESRRFVVTGGDFIFEGRDRPDPALNVDVQYRGGGTQIFITLQGTAFEPQLQLSSEPPMSQADILSVIIFGRPTAGLNAGETRQLSAQALALVGQGSRREIEKILGPALSPDVFTVHSEISTGSALEAGKYLSTDLYLRYRQNLSGEGGQNVGLEYRITDWLSLESQVGTTRDSGVDAILNWDFN